MFDKNKNKNKYLLNRIAKQFLVTSKFIPYKTSHYLLTEKDFENQYMKTIHLTYHFDI